MSHDLVIVNANIRTLDPALPHARALVSRAGEIIFVGDDAGARDVSQGAEVVDLQGRLVVPGLTDAHLHFCSWAQSLERINLEGCHSLGQALERVAARAAGAQPGALLMGEGWNHLDWEEPFFPDKRSLDTVAPANPVVLTRKDGHSVWVNTAALEACGITRDTPDPAGGRIEREPDGEPSGIIRENAIEMLGKGIGESADEIPLDLLQRAIAGANRAGLTGVHSIEGANALRAWQNLRARGKLTLRVVHGIPAESLHHALAIGLQRGFGDEWLRLQGVKIFADGSLGSMTAEMQRPFLGSDSRGMAVTDSEQMLSLARAAAAGGLDVWTHAIGDAAISRTLTVYETLRREGYSDTILRIEHVQHLSASDLGRFNPANVIASMQPIHQPSDMKMADDLLGPDRARYTYAFNSLRQAGATLAFGSDCPVERLEPLRGIHAAVTRQNAQGEPASGWFPEERLTVEQAVEGFTIGAAAAAGESNRAGTLSVGKWADAVVLSGDIFSIPAGEILNTQVDYTIVGGEIVYCRE
ncbi:MAG: amidohydrolase [Rudaea sp.]